MGFFTLSYASSPVLVVVLLASDVKDVFKFLSSPYCSPQMRLVISLTNRDVLHLLIVEKLIAKTMPHWLLHTLSLKVQITPKHVHTTILSLDRIRIHRVSSDEARKRLLPTELPRFAKLHP